MMLIADSGSTKTSWRLVDEEKKIHQFRTEGLNPYFLSKEKIAGIISTQLLPSLDVKFEGKLFFYGAGCRAEEKKEMLYRALHSVFPDAKIEVHTDMLGAARALCGRTEGIAAILGTGSNCCRYDGTKIQEQSPSLGFILGDEGSGAHIGKTFISALLNNELNSATEKSFFDHFKTRRDELLHAVYNNPLPNRYLAAYAKFVHRHLNDEKVAQLVADCFGLFFDRQVCRLGGHKKLKFNCAGAVGFYFNSILKKAAEERNILTGTITESPIAALTNYHLEEEPNALP